MTYIQETKLDVLRRLFAAGHININDLLTLVDNDSIRYITDLELFIMQEIKENPRHDHLMNDFTEGQVKEVVGVVARILR